MYNPVHVYKCAELLLAGKVSDRVLQPYESHISYLLSFLADYNLYGCDWIEFVDPPAFTERTGSDRTAVQGREIDVDVERIANRRRVEHEHRHTQVFETQSSEISISSLSEARESDAQWRSQVGMEPWKPLRLQPVFQKLMHEWKWEYRNELRNSLARRIVENQEAVPPDTGLWFNGSGLPTAAQIVPSIPQQAQRLSDQSEDWIMSQDELEKTQEIVKQKGVKRPRDSELFSMFDLLSQSDSSKIESLEEEEPLNMAAAFGLQSALKFAYDSPTTQDVERTNGVTSYTPLHFSNPEDVATLSLKYGGKEHFIKTLEPRDLPPLSITADPSFPRLQSYILTERRPEKKRRYCLELAELAPSTQDVQEWLDDRMTSSAAVLLSNPSDNFQFASLESRDDGLQDELLTCAIEVYAQNRPGKVPKASEDPVLAVFWHLTGADDREARNGVITTSPLEQFELPSLVVVGSEWEVLEETIKMVHYFNPDILIGYETNVASWAYLRTRYRKLSPSNSDSFYRELGRVRASSQYGNRVEDNEVVAGRYLLSLWNILRREVTLSKYTLEYVVYHTLHERIPHYDYDQLSSWWSSNDPKLMNTVVRYMMNRASMVLRLLSHFEIINRTCEKSRIIGIDFYSSLTRGSQFQVEAVMCRLSRRENYLLMSPSKAQVGQQNALEYIPLVMEPMSEFYTDPVCVLDFRSLYPSIIIAHNLCYSTCIGRVDLWRGKNKLGVKHDHQLQPGILSKVGEENIYVAPNGMGYVNPKIRKSLLAQMLGEILDTRFMINDTLKASSGLNARRQKNLYSKQLALKFIANVTYGYTSASFSGRMPCSELADSIVSAGRELLQWCIRRIEAVNKWGIRAKVVYGDTDSLFVKLPGVSKEQAFAIGREIASIITAETPDPIVLKLEKVYSPCILLTKKRYVGNAYEHENQKIPKFDAKGIETIRRDGTPIVQKIEKRALQTLFETCDLSQVKNYLYNQWRKILANRELKIQDFCFAQEVKLGHYKTANGISNLPGGAMVSLKKMQKDDGIEPQYRERVPFVITAGATGTRINERAVPPEEMMESTNLVLDADYYIEKTIIPPLERLFNLLGGNIRDWYAKMPRTVRVMASASGRKNGVNDGTLHGFLQNEACACCLENRTASSDDILCSDCKAQYPRSRYIITSRQHIEEQKLAAAVSTCYHCSGIIPIKTDNDGVPTHPCKSIDCPIYYEREGAHSEHRALLQLLNNMI